MLNIHKMFSLLTWCNREPYSEKRRVARGAVQKLQMENQKEKWKFKRLELMWHFYKHWLLTNLLFEAGLETCSAVSIFIKTNKHILKSVAVNGNIQVVLQSNRQRNMCDLSPYHFPSSLTRLYTKIGTWKDSKRKRLREIGRYEMDRVR